MSEVIFMAKQGMKRIEYEHQKNGAPPVPQIQGKARSGKKPAAPLIPGEAGKVFHGAPHETNDLAVENLMDDFDMTAADLQDFER